MSQGTAPLSVTFANSGSGATNYNWSFGNGTFSTQQNPPAVTYTAAGTYTVLLYADNGSCAAVDTAYVVVDAAVNIQVPNVYSPNGDAINDEWYIICSGIRDLHCDIFNRWGQLVYQLFGVDQKWDGIMINGNHATEGTYYYILDAVGYDGKEYKSHGPITLVK
jgi:gliding motility-associated-like protein